MWKREWERWCTDAPVGRRTFLRVTGFACASVLLKSCSRRDDVTSPDEAKNVADYGSPLEKEAAIQAAIDAAAASSYRVVFVPKEFFGYDAARIRFDPNVHMTREGNVTMMKDVLAYGALGEANHDDTPGIRAAIEAVSATGKRTDFLPPKTCAIDDEPRVERSDIRILGPGATIRQFTRGRKVLWAYGQSGIEVDGLTLVGTLNGEIFEGHALYFENCQKTVIKNCTIVDAEADAIKIKADGGPSTDHVIQNCTILDYGGQGILISADSGDLQNNRVSNVRIDSVVIDKATTLTFDPVFAGHGIYLSYVKDVTISNCTLKAVLVQGIQIEDGEGHTVVDCVLQGKVANSQRGHGVTCSGKDCSFSRLLVTGFNVGGGAGIRFSGARNCVLSDSTISDSESHDVVLLDASSCTVANCVMGGAFVENSNKVLWQSNELQGGLPSFRLRQSDDVVVTQGEVSGMTQQGIRAEGCKRLYIQEIGVFDNGAEAGGGNGIGIYFTNCNEIPCEDCVVADSIVCDSGNGYQGEAYRDEGLRNRFERNRYTGSIIIAPTGVQRDNERVERCESQG